jgi:hypothetical protein
MAAREDTVELTMDRAGLYREDVFTDRKAGVIRVLTPVTADGTFDGGRKILYVGEAQMLTPGGVLPLAFEIAATTLGEAVARFGDQAKAAVQQALDNCRSSDGKPPRRSSWRTGCPAPAGFPVAG